VSQSEIDRFAEDLKADAGLRAELASSATGIASVVRFAGEKGYKIKSEDVAAYIQAQTASELSDAQLDAIAGGKGGHHGHHHHHATGTYAAQTVAVATTEAVAAETTVNIAAEVELYGAVAVAAVAVVVVT